MNKKVQEWTNFFNKMFSEVKKKIFEQYRLEEDGSGPPEILALREVATNFPCPVRIAEIKIDTEKHKHIKEKVCQIIRYDFSKLDIARGSVEYYGVVDEGDSEKLRELLVKIFDLNNNYFEEFYKDFRTSGWGDEKINFYTQFPLYNVKNNFRKFVFDFLEYVFLTFEAKIRQKFRKGIDWNLKFNLKPDPIMPMSEIIKIDETLRVFSRFAEGAGVEELQNDICNIQLVPHVIKDVKRVFRRAKDLYIYGFFRYNFFTIARHYAFLALESAIKNRYYQSFGEEITLTNKKGETIKMGSIDHQTLIDFCHRRKGWNVRELKINDEKFAFSSRELLDWLIRKEIINMWERKQCEYGFRSRHIMSHLTHVFILTPGHSMQALKFVANIINKLYTS